MVQHFRFLVDFHRLCCWHALELSAAYGESGTQSKTVWIVELPEHRTKVLMSAEVTYEACVVSCIFQQDNDTARVDGTPPFYRNGTVEGGKRVELQGEPLGKSAIRKSRRTPNGGLCQNLLSAKKHAKLT